jgi:hypothetical protein
VVTANRAERVAVAALNLAIGLNVSAPTQIVDRTDEPPFALTLAECLQRAVDNRREFQVAQRDIEVAALRWCAPSSSVGMAIACFLSRQKEISVLDGG